MSKHSQFIDHKTSNLSSSGKVNITGLVHTKQKEDGSVGTGRYI
jgi:hypothetical protein